MGTYRISTAGDRQYHFVLYGPDGGVLLLGETCLSRNAAFLGISACIEESSRENRYSRFTKDDGLHYFRLSARGGEPIGCSEGYSSAAARDSGIDAVKVFGPTATIVEQASTAARGGPQG
jgi:uncharacterized protein